MRSENMRYLLAHLTAMPQECDLWPFVRDHSGYGRVSVGGRMHSVHVLVCEWYRGPRPSQGHVASHSCGNGHLGCFTPAHLSWQTRTEDAADRARHGRTARGERGGRAKLTVEDVVEIRRRAANGDSATVLARQFHVNERTVRDVVSRRNWKHI